MLGIHYEQTGAVWLRAIPAWCQHKKVNLFELKNENLSRGTDIAEA